MASKLKKLYICSNCGYETAKWLGKCPDCGSWNTLNEEVRIDAPPQAAASAAACAAASVPAPVTTLDEVESGEEIRYITGISELDRVLGGGMVPGSVILVSGDPGIGKSTLLLQMCQPLSALLKILYVTGEESTRQIKLRAMRLGVQNNGLMLCACNDVGQILATIGQNSPDLVIIDSIQTISAAEISSSSGSVSQVRECTQRLTRLAKEREIPLFLVGHVNKDGAIAGPKVLEHMVDAVLYFEGERGQTHRIIRAAKNRFGSTSELAVFEMTGTGLREVDNPSELLIPMHEEGLSGTAIAATIDGTRPLLFEVQALVSSAVYGTAQRSTTGFDTRRLNMLLAVLEKKAGFKLGAKDVFLNMAGGLKVNDPACDLAVVGAVLSSNFDMALPSDVCFAAEIGLSGEVRPVSQAERRVAEAARLGFKTIYLSSYTSIENVPGNIRCIRVRDVPELVRTLFK